MSKVTTPTTPSSAISDLSSRTLTDRSKMIDRRRPRNWLIVNNGFFDDRARTSALIVLALVVLACIIFLIVYFATGSDDGSADRRMTSSSEITGRLMMPIVQKDWMPNCPLNLNETLLDCHPESGQTESRCRNRGCCWIDGGGAKKNSKTLEHPEMIKCIYPSNYGYIVSGPEEQFADGWEMPLTRLHVPSRYGDDIHRIKVRVEMQTPTRLRVKFYNPNSDSDDGWVEPEEEPIIPQEKIDFTKSTTGKVAKLYAVSYHHSSIPFGLQVRRVETGTVIFNTSLSGLTFANQFLQIAIGLPSRHVHGLGPLMPTTEDSERNYTRWPTWSLFSSHTHENQNGKIHGGHPMYMCLENDGRAHAVLFHSSYPVDMQLKPSPHMTYRALGGSLDFYIFLGPTPEDVVKQYTEAVGRPFLPPYWALGLQISQVGTMDIESVKESLRDVHKSNISYDVVSLGSEYINNGLDFTIDHRRFPNLLIFSDELKREQRYLDIDLDPAISQEQPQGTYPPYDEGLRNEVFIKNAFDSEPLTGKTSSGKSVYIDFGSSDVTRWWTRNLERRQSSVRFDSLSLVENYPSSWRNGTQDACLRDNSNHPPYLPRALAKSRLYWHTICMDGLQWQGKRKVRHYSSHNLYGHQMAKVTYSIMSSKMSENNRRPMVVSQSTFTGSGKYTGFWAMDNARTWSYLAQSIKTVLSYNIYGVPLVGSAICGMDVSAEDNELCMRWIQLGAFYPFARMATTEGGTVARPLFHEFYWDENTYNITSQFMWGPSLMIVPILTKGTRLIDIYLPHGIWYFYHTGGRMESCGERITMEAPLDRIILLVRGGAILPTQAAGLTTAQSRQNNFHLVVALDGNYTASGQLFWDDGITKDTYLNNEYVLVNFTVEKNSLTVSGVAMKRFLPSSLISEYFVSVDILGLPYKPRVMSISGTSGVLGNRQLTWDNRAKVAKLRKIILPFTGKVKIDWRWTD